MGWFSKLFVGDTVKVIAGGIGDYVKRKQELKIKKLDNEARIEEAKTTAFVNAMQKRVDADIDWEQMSIQNSGWKDEYLTIFITSIVAACFIPWTQPYVDKGFDTLTLQTPMWFQVSFLVVVGSAFGVRVFDNFQKLIRSNK